MKVVYKKENNNNYLIFHQQHIQLFYMLLVFHVYTNITGRYNVGINIPDEVCILALKFDKGPSNKDVRSNGGGGGREPMWTTAAGEGSVMNRTSRNRKKRRFGVKGCDPLWIAFDNVNDDDNEGNSSCKLTTKDHNHHHNQLCSCYLLFRRSSLFRDQTLSNKLKS